jgi:hypothetical protein
MVPFTLLDRIRVFFPPVRNPIKRELTGWTSFKRPYILTRLVPQTMPTIVSTLPPVRRWVPAPVTKEDSKQSQPFTISMGADAWLLVDWADLTFIDIAKAKTPEGRAEQVRLARDATHRQGFFYVINHGLDKAIVGYHPL